MIIHAEESNREELTWYLSKEPEFNLFMIGDIEHNGFDQDFQDVWFDREDAVHWMILRWGNSLCLQSYENQIDENFVNDICDKYGIVTLQGKAALLNRYEWENYPSRKNCSFASLHHRISSVNQDVKILKEEDSEEIAVLENRCFHTDKNNSEAIKREMQNQTTRYYGICIEGRLAGNASSTSESKDTGMIVGLCVDPSFRKRGYGSQLIACASNDLLSRGKIPCLFYSNPAAARIYKKAGYQDIGNWSIREK